MVNNGKIYVMLFDQPFNFIALNHKNEKLNKTWDQNSTA